jgi:hypothetical protein
MKPIHEGHAAVLDFKVMKNAMTSPMRAATRDRLVTASSERSYPCAKQANVKSEMIEIAADANKPATNARARPLLALTRLAIMVVTVTLRTKPINAEIDSHMYASTSPGNGAFT